MTTVVFLRSGKLGVRTPHAELWFRTMKGPSGSVELSRAEAKVCRVVMLRKEPRRAEIAFSVWPNPDREPQNPMGQLTTLISLLNKKKLRSIGLEITPAFFGNPQSGRVLVPWEARPMIARQCNPSPS